MTRKPLIYVSGPMAGAQGSSYVGNIRMGIDVANDLERLGAVPLCPHTSMLWGIVYPGKSHEELIARDLDYVDVCDALVRIPGDSKGADLEVEHARNMGIPVFFLSVGIKDFVVISSETRTFIEQFKPRHRDDVNTENLAALKALVNTTLKQRDEALKDRIPFAEAYCKVLVQKHDQEIKGKDDALVVLETALRSERNENIRLGESLEAARKLAKSYGDRLIAVQQVVNK